MNSNGILHATVDPLGTVRLYDTPRDLNLKKGPFEIQIALALTAAQQTIVYRAAAVAKKKQEEKLAAAPVTEHDRYLKDPAAADPRD